MSDPYPHTILATDYCLHSSFKLNYIPKVCVLYLYLKMYRQLELRMSNLQVVELSHISQISEFVQLTTFKDFQ
jgi:hypothetical protein